MNAEFVRPINTMLQLIVTAKFLSFALVPILQRSICSLAHVFGLQLQELEIENKEAVGCQVHIAGQQVVKVEFTEFISDGIIEPPLQNFHTLN